MTRPMAFASVLGLFVLGIVVGALGMHVYEARLARPPLGSMMGPGDVMRPGGAFWQRVRDRLELTPDQRDEIERILDEARAEGEALHDDVMPRVRALMDRTHERLMEVLTPEQRTAFEQMHLRQRRGAEWFFLGHGPQRGRRHGPWHRRGDGGGDPLAD